jgi:hypothetical protein
VATIECDCHGKDRSGMALERRFGFPGRQIPNAQDLASSAQSSCRISLSLTGLAAEQSRNGSGHGELSADL